MIPSDHRDAAGPLGLLFAPASCYPVPVAYAAARDGTIMHTWSHPADQPRCEDNPPSYLRGWNHVEVDGGGNLFAIVPLRSLLKLTPSSQLEWSCDIAAHHDLAIDEDGTILILTEAPRRVKTGGYANIVLDNLVTLVNPAGTVKTAISLYDILRTDPGLRQLIDDLALRRAHEFPGDTDAILTTAQHDVEMRQRLQRLRDLPGSPCDILHTNTVELVKAHPQGIWSHGDVLLCMRELDTIAVVDLARAQVRWWWGPGQLSGPHQPSMLPDGRVLVFDNGRGQLRTRLLKVDPCTNTVEWHWSAQPPQSFFCPLAGGCEQLPDGNILVTNSTAGAAFELTHDGRIIWRLALPASTYGRERGRVSIYRMSAVQPDVMAKLGSAPPQCAPAAAFRPGGTKVTDLAGGVS